MESLYKQKEARWAKLGGQIEANGQNWSQWGKLVGKIEASGQNWLAKLRPVGITETKPIRSSNHPIVSCVGKTHIQGKDLDASLDLHWKAGASKNIRGEVACNFCDTGVIFQCQIWWMSFAGAALCHLGQGRSPDRVPIIEHVLFRVGRSHISDAFKPEVLKSVEGAH